jgi:HemY protein
MRLIVFLLILTAIVGISAGAFIYIDAGYVMLSFDVYTLETSLWMFLLLAAVALFAIYIVVRSLLVLLGSDRRFNEWRQRRRSQRARRQTTR